MKFCAIIGNIFTKCRKVKNYCIRQYQLSMLKSRGGGAIYIGANCILTPHKIELGDDIYIGANCVFQSTYGYIKIGDHCMFGPGVHIHGGNHKFHEIGRLMKNATPKKEGDDGIVLIEEDCWIGSNAIILSNVTVGKGSIIGAGAIVTKDVAPYSIYTGCPDVKIRRRFTEEEIREHELKIHQRN